ncbi:pyridoxal phosphate-dependent transferase [Cytidiella melzeri]|nr:pyridoxal phosphate-dependent transferase [Cytidiella melzeri]
MEGFFNNWDLCKFKSNLGEQATRFSHHGMWEFMSATSLKYPFKPSKLADDFEGFIHVITYCGLQFHCHSMTAEEYGNWRLPGFRVCWVLGPKNLITTLLQSGSFLDGCANHPLQLAAIPFLEPEHVHDKKVALQKHFKHKRDHVLKCLARIGLKLNLEHLPTHLKNGVTFFEELLKEKCIGVPGIFFDINPSRRRNLFSSPCHHFIRLSFGSPIEVLNMGVDAMARVLKRAKKEGMHVFGHSCKKSLGGSGNHV